MKNGDTISLRDGSEKLCIVEIVQDDDVMLVARVKNRAKNGQQGLYWNDGPRESYTPMTEEEISDAIREFRTNS